MTSDGGKVVSWRRLGAEFLTIVMGVMVALAADRWASHRQEARQQHEHLVQLEADFSDNREIAQQAIDVKRRFEQAAQSVLAALHGGRDTTWHSPLPVDIELAGWYHEPQYLSDAWQDLVSTGNVGLIRNGDLRIAISRFYQTADAAGEYEREWRAYVMAYRESVTNVLDPYLRVRILDLYPKNQIEDSLGIRAPDSELLARLRRLPVVPGQLADVIMVNRTGAFFTERSARGIDTILVMVRKELKKD